MAEIVCANLYSVSEFDGAKWRIGFESYESAKSSFKSAQNGDILMIGRRDTLGRVEPRMFCRFREAGTFGQQRWHDVGLLQLRIAKAIDAGDAIPAHDAVTLLASEIGAGKPWVQWNETHDAILKIAAPIRDLCGMFGDEQFMQVANAYNAANA